MKRKYADRPNWKRVTSRRMLAEKLENEEFTGHVVLIYIEKVREPLWVDIGGKKECVVDKNYSWLSLFPQGENYVVTAMFNGKDEIVQWYIDICRDQGFTDKNIPWYDDLYLDIIISAEGHVSLIDEDDLALALKQHVIKQEDFDFAYREAYKLLDLIANRKFNLLQYSQIAYKVLKNKLQIEG